MPLFGRPTVQDDQRAAAWRDWMQQRNPLAIASVVVGIFSLIEFGAIPIFSAGAVVLGVCAILQIRKAKANGPTLHYGRRLAWSGIVLGILSLGVSVYIYTLPLRH